MSYAAEWMGLDYWVFARFSFRIHTQSSGWDKAIAFRNIKHGQYLAHFFIDEGGSLDFDKMCQTLNELVGEGCVDPFKELYERTKLVIGPRPEVDNVWMDELAIHLGFEPDEWLEYLGLDSDPDDYGAGDVEDDVWSVGEGDYDEDDEVDEWEDEGTVFRVKYN